MRKRRWTRDQVWQAVRSGSYLAYRHTAGRHWEWRLQAIRTHDPNAAVGHQQTTMHYG
jgi:hypothetical protein